MKDQEIDIVRGSGNVFRDFDDVNADVNQLKAEPAPVSRTSDCWYFSDERRKEMAKREAVPNRQYTGEF